jgi:hypothetical protein
MTSSLNKLKFRFATSQDIEALALVYTQAVLREQTADEVYATDYTNNPLFISKKQELEANLSDASSNVLVALAADDNGDYDIKGFIRCSYVSDSTMNIDDFFVSDRQKGIGKKLLMRALKFHHNIDEVTVDTTRYAHEIYQRFGFEPVEDRQMLLPTDRLRHWQESMQDVFPKYAIEEPDDELHLFI